MLKLLLVLGLCASQIFAQGTSLVFGANTTDRADCGSAVGDDPSSLSLAFWTFITTHTDSRAFMSQARPTSNVGWRIRLSGTGGNLRWLWNRATASQDFVTDSTPVVTTSKWYFVALTTDGTGGNVHIYVGDRDTPAVEATYSTSTGGTGAITANAARNFMIGNQDNVTPDAAIQARMAMPAFWYNDVLSLGELIDYQFKPKRSALASQRLFTQLGFNGVNPQPDWSGNGNTCTVTGATLGIGPPLAPLYSAIPQWFLAPLAYIFN